LPHWDVFHSDRLEAERSLTAEAVRDALARGDLGEDDLVRPSGESRWSRIADSPDFGDLGAPGPEPGRPAVPPPIDPEEGDPAEGDRAWPEIAPDSPASIGRDAPARSDFGPIAEFEIASDSDAEPEITAPARQPSSVAALPVLPDEEAQGPDLPELPEDEEGALSGEFDPQDEDDDAAEFTLSRNAPETVEELDLAAMVDVAFQLVLFFLVTASTVVFKTLEVPRPNEDKPPEAAAQGRAARPIDELEKDYILVEVDAEGSIKVDRQPVNPDRAALTERLRSSREATHRKAMLLSADFATRHKNAVLVFDVASEIDLSIAIAQPTGKK